MPDGQKQQREELTRLPVAEETQPLVNVLGGEEIGVAVKALYVVMELSGSLETQQLDVVAAVPLAHVLAGLCPLLAVVRQPESDARRWKDKALF